MKLWIATLLFFYGGLLLANDASFGGEASQLIPLQETKIQMVSEEVLLEQKKSSHTWHVIAHYSFYNPTNNVVTLQMGFPERHCDMNSLYELCNSDGRFRNLKTWVRGKRVEEKKGRVAAKHRWAPKLGDIYLYEVTFNPKEAVAIKHEYSYDGSVYVAGDFAEYVTETGGFWNGPIQDAKFVIRTWRRPSQIVFPASFQLKSYLEYPQKGDGGITEILFAMKNWTPKEDLTLFLERDPQFEEHSFWIPEEIAKLSLAEAERLRNQIFARHGYPFKNSKWHKLFYQSPQVKDNFLYEADWQRKTKWVHLQYRENSHYHDSLLTAKEKELVKQLQGLEAERSN